MSLRPRPANRSAFRPGPVPRTHPRIRVDGDGRVEIVDPCLNDVPLLKSIDPSYSVRSEPLEGFSAPRLLDALKRSTEVVRRDLSKTALGDLWSEHDRAAGTMHRPGARRTADCLTLLELKAVIARRMLEECNLCGRRCGMNRTLGPVGPCGLGTQAYVAEHFVHVGEEAPINPSLILQLRGCAARCRGCQQYGLLDPRGHASEELTPALWQSLNFNGARSLSFCGGNPDESLAPILAFLEAAPASLSVPVVWNSNALMSAEAIRLLDGIVDAYVPDLKFAEENCARSYMRVENYPAIARAAIRDLLGQGVPVIVRILVMPGHVECCHLPSLAWLGALPNRNLQVSIRDQFVPDWRIGPGEPLARRPSSAEVGEVRSAAASLGLRRIGAA